MSEPLLIVAPNWLGDAVMCMPALQRLAEREAPARIAVLTKPPLAALWSLQPAVEERIEYGNAWREMRRAADRIRAAGFRRAYVLPNSFRSALPVWLAGVPERVGRRGGWRSWLLTQSLPPPNRRAAEHQSWEYADVLGCGARSQPLPEPRLRIPEEAAARCRERWGDADADGGWAALLPGAARGPAKRWPAEHFAEVGRRLRQARGCRILVLGAAAERELCGRVATAIGAGAENLAGATSLPELAALLRACRVAVANDSGGMHLAAAVGTPVVALFGLTDPARTGPLGRGHRVFAAPAAARGRDIPRESAAAAAALRAVGPEAAAQAALEIMAGRA